MTKNTLPIIQTERLLLQQLKESDWKMISYLRSDKTVNRFVKRPNAPTKEKALEFITRINTEIESQKMYYWKITTKIQNEMLGSICLWNFSKNRKTAEIGYDLSPKYQKQGIMNESMVSVIDFGFRKLNLNLIEAYTHKNNTDSTKLLIKNGFILVKNKKDKQNSDNSIYELKKDVLNT